MIVGLHVLASCVSLGILMKLHHTKLIISFSLLLILMTAGCSPRYKSLINSQREYRYQIPEKIDDGWETSSLEEEGVNSEIIIFVRTKIV